MQRVDRVPPNTARRPLLSTGRPPRRWAATGRPSSAPSNEASSRRSGSGAQATFALPPRRSTHGCNPPHPTRGDVSGASDLLFSTYRTGATPVFDKTPGPVPQPRFRHTLVRREYASHDPRRCRPRRAGEDRTPARTKSHAESRSGARPSRAREFAAASRILGDLRLCELEFNPLRPRPRHRHRDGAWLPRAGDRAPRNAGVRLQAAPRRDRPLPRP